MFIYEIFNVVKVKTPNNGGILKRNEQT